MKRKIFISMEAKNVAPKFCKAIYRSYKVNQYYSSLQAAKMYHNLSKCNYYTFVSDNDGNETKIQSYYNCNKVLNSHF